jgi:hypothetical protein
MPHSHFTPFIESFKIDAGATSPNYQRLLRKWQEIAAKRAEEDRQRIVVHEREDKEFEGHQARRAAILEASLADLQRKHETHSAGYLRILKEKQRQEIIELEKRHAAQLAQAEIDIILESVQMRESHEVHRQGLKIRLDEENKRLGIRALAQNKPDGKRYIEDYNLKGQVFNAFERDAGTGKSTGGSQARSKSQVAAGLRQSSRPPRKDTDHPFPKIPAPSKHQ